MPNTPATFRRGGIEADKSIFQSLDENILRRTWNAFLLPILAVSILIALAGRPACGQTLTWDASGTSAANPKDGSATWSTSGTNWSNGTSDSGWTTGDTAVIGNGNGAAGTITVGTVSVANMIFNAPGSGSYTLSGGTITLTSGTITDNNTLGVTTINSVIAGSAGLTVAGSGTLALGGANTYTGTTTISSGGIVQVGTGGTVGSLGSGNIVDNGSLVYNLATGGSVVLPSGTAITGSGNLSATAGNISWNGNVTLGGSQSYTQIGNNGTLSEGLQVAASSVLTASSISITGDIGEVTANGNYSLALNTSAANGPITLNMSFSRSGVWYGLSSFTANSGTGTINVVGTGPSSTGWNNTPVTLTGGIVNITANVNSGAPVTINPSLTGTVSGVLSGAMSLTKGGVGTLVLTGNNTYTGTTTISSGTLQVGNGGANGSLGTGNFVDNATLIYNLPTSGYVPLTSGSGSGNLSVIAPNIGWSGNITLGGSQSYTQVVTAATGGLYVGYQVDAPTVLTGSSISIVGDVGIPYGNGNSLALNTSAANGPITLNISLGKAGVWYELNSFTANAGSGTISVVGEGYTGTGTASTLTTNGGWYGTPVTLTGGVVNIAPGSIYSTASITINPSLTGTVSANLYGTTSLTKGGVGTLVLTAVNQYTGATIVNSGTLQISGANNSANIASTSSITINNGGAISIVGDNNYLYTAPGAVLTMINSGGLLTISATNTAHLGTMTLLGGTLASTGTPSGDGTLYGVWNLDHGVTAGGTTTTSTISALNVALTQSGSTVFTVNSGASNGIDLDVTGYFGNPSGVTSTGLVKAGSGVMRLDGTNTYTTATTISAGTLQLGDGVSRNGSVAGNITDNASLVFANPAAQTYAKVISGSGTVTVSGPGAITLTGTNTYSGATKVNAGTLVVTGTLSNSQVQVAGGTLAGSGYIANNVVVGTGSGAPSSSIIAPSAGGGVASQSFINIGGNLTLNSDAAFQFKLDSNTGYNDALLVTGTLSLLNAPTLIGSDIGNTPLFGTQFIIAEANGGITGTFANDPEGADIIIGLNTYSIDYTVDGNTEIVLTAVTPATAYWQGALSGTWATVTSGSTNFTSDAAGTTNTGVLPGAATNVKFTANSGSNLNTVLGQNFTINSLEFTGAGSTAATSSVTISGSTLTINASGINGNTAGSGIVVDAGSAAHTISSNVVLGSSQAWTVNGNTLTVSGNISDSGSSYSLTKSGTGMLVLSGSASYSGTTGVNAGTLEVDGSTSGSSAVTVNTATLQGTGTVGGTVALTGSSTLASAGNLTLARGFSVSGSASTLSNGTITGNATQNAASAFTVNGTLSGSDTLAAGASLAGTGFVGATTLNGTDNLSSAATLTVASLTVNNGGNTISSGTVDATGGTTLNANSGLAVNGTLEGTVSVGSGATLTGTGTVTAGVTVGAGGITSPGGTAPGVMTTDLAYSASSTANFNVASSGSAGVPQAQNSHLFYSQMIVTGGSGAVSLAIGNNVTLGANSTLSVAQTGSQILGTGASNSGVTLQLSISSTDYATLLANKTNNYLAKSGNTGLDNYFVFNLGTTLSTGRFTTLDIDVSGVNTSGTIYYATTANDRFAADGVGNTIGDVYIGSQEFALSYTGLMSANSTTGGNDIVLTAIPEPGTWGMILGGFGMLIGFQRFRRRRNG